MMVFKIQRVEKSCANPPRKLRTNVATLQDSKEHEWEIELVRERPQAKPEMTRRKAHFDTESEEAQHHLALLYRDLERVGGPMNTSDFSVSASKLLS